MNSTVSKAPWTLLLDFAFLLFEMVKIDSCFSVVSREIEIAGRFYTYLYLIVYNFSIAHSALQLFEKPQLNQTHPKELKKRCKSLLQSLEEQKIADENLVKSRDNTRSQHMCPDL